MKSSRADGKVTRKWRIVTPVLAGLGAFLIVSGALGLSYLPNKVVKVPLDVDLKSHLEGQAQMVGADAPVPIKVLNHTLIDASRSNDTLATWETGSCIVVDAPGVPDCVRADDKQYRLVTASTNAFVTDRATALGVDDGPMIGDDVNPTQGIVNKFPFGSEKKTYPYWNSTLQTTVEARYEKSVTLHGVETYVYKISVPLQDAEIADGVEGKYGEETEVYVEPMTGIVVNQVTDQQRLLPDGAPAMLVQAHFTDDQVAESVESTRSTITELKLLRLIPIIGLTVGPLVLLVAILLGLMSHAFARRARTQDVESPVAVPAST